MATHDEIIDIVVDADHIAGTLVAPSTLVPAVLFVHGWGGDQTQYLTRAREVAALGCICLAFDLRGHAKTRSKFETVSREDNLRDVIAAYDVLARYRGVDPSQIAVVGSSYGGYLAALLTELRPVRWLALRAPALYKDTDWALPKLQLRKVQDLETYRRLNVLPDASRALKACRAFAGDVLVVESENDMIVPHQVVANYRQACVHAHSVTHRLISGADHALSDQRWCDVYTRHIVDWLAQMIRTARLQEETGSQVYAGPVG